MASTCALLMSLISMVCGSVFFFFRRQAFHRHHARMLHLNARDAFEAAIGWLARLAGPPAGRGRSRAARCKAIWRGWWPPWC
ncbi:hypothetical protein ACU4GD_21290 [Cupriavidus basilensis]